MDNSDFYHRHACNHEVLAGTLKNQHHASKQKRSYKIQNNRPVPEKQVQTVDFG